MKPEPCPARQRSLQESSTGLFSSRWCLRWLQRGDRAPAQVQTGVAGLSQAIMIPASLVPRCRAEHGLLSCQLGSRCDGARIPAHVGPCL